MAATQVKLTQLQQESASDGNLIMWDTSSWIPSTIGNLSLDSGTGGIYKGNGTTTSGLTVTLTDSMLIRFASTDPVLDINGAIEGGIKLTDNSGGIITMDTGAITLTDSGSNFIYADGSEVGAILAGDLGGFSANSAAVGMSSSDGATASSYVNLYPSGKAFLRGYDGTTDNFIGFDYAVGDGIWIKINNTLPSTGDVLVAGADGTFYFDSGFTSLINGTGSANQYAYFSDSDTLTSGIGAVFSSSSIPLDMSAATGAVKLTVGTVAQRPSNAAGLLRYNSDDFHIEWNYGFGWISVPGSNITQSITGAWTFSGDTYFTGSLARFYDSNFTLANVGIASFGVFDLSGLTASTTRTYGLPDTDGTLLIGTGTAGHVALWTGTGILSEDSGITYDGTYNAINVDNMGIGGAYNNSYVEPIQIHGAAAAGSQGLIFRFFNSGGSYAGSIGYANNPSDLAFVSRTGATVFDLGASTLQLYKEVTNGSTYIDLQGRADVSTAGVVIQNRGSGQGTPGTYPLLLVKGASSGQNADLQRWSHNTTILSAMDKDGHLIIGGSGSSIDASAALQVDSTTQGILLPRMLESERDAITSPADGLIVYVTDTDVLSLRANSTWVDLTPGGGDGNGIYDGSNTIPSSTVATVTSSSDFSIAYNGGNPGIYIDDNTSLAGIYSKDNGSSVVTYDGFVLATADTSASMAVISGNAVTFSTTETQFVGPVAIAPSGGSFSIDSAAILQLDTTTKGLLLPRMTTTQRNAIGTPPDGLLIYDTTTDFLNIRANGAWVELDVTGGGDGNGIYDGSGTIASGAVATVPSTGTFTFAYDGANPAIQVNDSDASTVIYDKTGNYYSYMSSTGVETVGIKQDQLIAAPSADHTISGTTIVLTANEGQNFGDVCYINSSGYAQLGDASAATTASVVVMCTETVSASGTATYLLMGVARDDTWAWTVGGNIYLSITGTTGNTLTQTAPTGTGEIVQIVGVATHADRMIFNPNLAIVELT